MTRVRLTPTCRRCVPLWSSADVIPGKVHHGHCRGTGWIGPQLTGHQCRGCQGTGWVTCPVCDGRGVPITPRQFGWGRWSRRRRTEPGRPWWRF